MQSHVSAHSELAWILNCFIPMGRMERMTQFKEKSGKRRQEASVGLFDYPALMAADILLYKADVVHVGEDQKQHLELTRDVARRFNTIYGDVFTVPEAAIPAKGARIMGLKDPLKKMSKSENREDDAIYLLDTPDQIRSKIMKAATDSQRGIRYDEKRPGLYNLLMIYEIFSGNSRESIEAHFAQKGYQELKRELADLVVEHLRPFQERYRELSVRSGAYRRASPAGSCKSKTPGGGDTRCSQAEDRAWMTVCAGIICPVLTAHRLNEAKSLFFVVPNPSAPASLPEDQRPCLDCPKAFRILPPLTNERSLSCLPTPSFNICSRTSCQNSSHLRPVRSSSPAVQKRIADMSARIQSFEQLRPLFNNPPAAYRSAPLWVWNDDMTEEEIDTQLADFKEKGIGGVFVHPRPGLITPYISDRWNALFKHTTEKARALGMDVWIYDENSYPSGFAGGHVPAQMPESYNQGVGLIMTTAEAFPQKLARQYFVILRKDKEGYVDVTADSIGRSGKKRELRLL